jgi:hypothetical protein
MDTILVKVADLLLSMGFPGLVIGALGYCSRKLWMQYSEVQEARIREGRQVIQAIEDNTNTLNRLVDLLNSQLRG